MDLFGDFPFTDFASSANLLALLLTPIIRQFIDGQAPMAIIDAPAAGTGKTLLAELVSAIATGRAAALLTIPSEDDELSKRITSALATGATIINADNVDCRLCHPSLAAALTRGTWEQRLLGTNDRVLRLPQRATWIATGNNIRLGGDMGRRCFWIRLDARDARPWRREKFKHADLLAYARQRRGELIGALLTIARGWLVAGQPMPADAPRLGSFESWARACAGMLAYAGIPGFLTNADEMLEIADDDATEWEAFLNAWHAVFLSRAVTVAEVAEQIKADREFGEAVPAWMAESLDRGGHTFRRKLGNALRGRRDRPCPDGVILRRADGDAHNKVARWRVDRPSSTEAQS